MDTEAKSEQPGLRWFAAWTRSRQEKTAAKVLEALQIPNFLPMRSEVRQWSDRKQMVKSPLFNGYLFVRIDPAKESRLQILKTPGIVGLVGNQTGPLSIPDEQIDAIRKVLSQPVDCSVLTNFESGDQIKVIRGPLAGVRGVLIRAHSGDRLVVSIELIQKSLSVNVSRSDVVLEGQFAA